MKAELTLLITNISTSSHRKTLKNKIETQIARKPSIVCPVLNRRKVSLTKFLIINDALRSNLNRFQSFAPAIELIRKAKLIITTSKYKNSYELRGVTKDTKLIVCHIRDEKTRVGRKLYLISCYWKQL